MKDSQRFIAIINTAIRYCKWLIVILVALICCSGIRVVNNHEVAVVLRFGRLVGDTREEQVKEPGLLLAFPYVIDEVIKVPVGKVHEVSITTHAASADPTYAEIEDTGYVITGDENIIHIDATLKYQISDPVEYALYNSDPETEINGVVSGVMTSCAASKSVDGLLVAGRMITSDWDAHMSTRNTVSCMVQGQAAGTAAALAAADGTTVRTVDVPKLQRTLREQGVFFG